MITIHELTAAQDAGGAHLGWHALATIVVAGNTYSGAQWCALGADATPDEIAAAILSAYAPPPPDPHAPPPAPVARVVLSRLEFTRRFTLTENATINAVRINPATPLPVRAQLETLRDYLDRATLIDVTDGDTIAGTHAAVDVLVSAGVVRAADKPARIAAILAPAAD